MTEPKKNLTTEENEKPEEKKKYFYGKGGRKESIALVRIFPNGKGEFLINKKDYKIYFPYFEFQDVILSPLKLVGLEDKVDISVKVKGGGKRAQAEAIRHGIARGLLKFNSNFRSPLKKAGFLTRDSRVKERKKPGLKRARRAPQWSKR